MLLYVALFGCAPQTDPAADAAVAEAATDTAPTGCGADSALAYGQIVQATGAWTSYVDGGPVYCTPSAESGETCLVAMRIPATALLFLFQFSLVDESGTTLDSSQGAMVPSYDAGDPCYTASGGYPMSTHGADRGEGQEVTLLGHAAEATISEDDIATAVEGGVTYDVGVTGVVAYSAE